MKCPYCKEEIERFSQTCNICGERIPKIYSYVNYLKDAVSSPITKVIIKKSAITTVVLAVIVAFIMAIVGIVRYTISEVESNKFTDNGYRSIVNDENYTRALLSHADIGEQFDKILPLFEDMSMQEQDLLKFFKKSKSKEDNVKLFTIFINNMDKYREDTEFIYNNADKTFESLRIKTSKTVITSNEGKPIAILSPAIKSFYLILNNSNGNNYVWFKYDYKYMLEIYAPYLSDDWKDYFTLQNESEKDWKGVELGTPKFVPMARKWGKKWGDFVKKYPNFIYANEFAEYAFDLNSY